MGKKIKWYSCGYHVMRKILGKKISWGKNNSKFGKKNGFWTIKYRIFDRKMTLYPRSVNNYTLKSILKMILQYNQEEQKKFPLKTYKYSQNITNYLSSVKSPLNSCHISLNLLIIPTITSIKKLQKYNPTKIIFSFP